MVNKTKNLILHHLYTGYCGIKESESQIALSLVKSQFQSRGHSTILAQKQKSSALGATFTNSVMMHSVQQEDTYKGLHPGPHVIPAAISLAEQESAHGRDILTSIVAGYEVNLQLGEICAVYTSPRGWRGTTIFGILGSAATAAKILGLDLEQTMDALAMATNLASGLMQCWLSGTSEWLFTSGLAAQNGILSALIAKNGGKGAIESFEGDRGYFKAYLGVQPEGIEVIARNLRREFFTMKVILKPYSVITTILPVINNVVKLANQDDLNYEDIREVRILAGPRVTAGPLSTSILDKGPFVNKTQAFKSLPCSIGIALKYRDVSPQTVEYYQESAVRTLAGKVIVDTDEKTEGFLNQVEITTNDGRKHSIEGDEFPTLSFEQVKRNLTRAASEYIPTPKVAKLIQAIDNLERISIGEVSQNLS